MAEALEPASPRPPLIESERLILREFREGDLDAYARICADPEVMRFLGGQPYDRAQSWRHMATMLGHWTLRGYGLWAVVGPRYGPWTAVRGPTREEPQRPIQVRARNSPVFLDVPPASGPAGVAVVNGDGEVLFMRPVRSRQ